MRFVFELFIYVLQIYVWIIIIRVILSWFKVSPRRGVWLTLYRFIIEITEPFLRTFKKIIPSIRIGGAYLDLSFIAAILVIQFIIFLLRIIIYRALI
ncbi:MAG: YggT family protein [Actinomycetota bacterium]